MHYFKSTSGSSKFENEPDKALVRSKQNLPTICSLILRLHIQSIKTYGPDKIDVKIPQNGYHCSSPSEQFLPKTETMASLQQIRKYRLPKSGTRRRFSIASTIAEQPNEHQISSYMKTSFDEDSMELDEEIDNFPKYPEISRISTKYHNTNEAQEEDVAKGSAQPESLAKKSRELHARSIPFLSIVVLFIYFIFIYICLISG